MRRTTILAACLLTLSGLATLPAAAALRPYLPGVQVATIADPQVTESSGLAASQVTPGVVWTMNDSGGPATVFAIDVATGATRAAVVLEQPSPVPGVEQVDWEDLAVGPGPDGTPHVYVGDIGDNVSGRPFVHLLVFPEPDLSGVAEGTTITVPLGDYGIHVLVYEDGPRDAETLLVDPVTGQVTIVTKTLPRTGIGRLPIDPENGFSGIYQAPNPLGAVNVLTREADFDLRDLVTVEGDAALWATAGDIAPDGSRVVIRTLFEAFEFEVVDGDVVAALGTDPLEVALPAVQQGESITYTADAVGLLSGSEGTGSPLHLLLPVPEDEVPEDEASEDEVPAGG